MIYKIKENLWFDADKLNIIKGENNYSRYLKNYDYFPDAKNKAKIRKYPAIVFLSSTTCNLKCKYCYADEGTYHDVSNKNQFQLDSYIIAYKTLKSVYGKIGSINFFGGEPLLNFEEIRKFIKYLNDSQQQQDIPTLSIGSNGTIMNNKIKGFIKEHNVDFSTSLDGPKNINDIARIGNGISSTHDSVIETIQSLSELNIRIAVQFTINKLHIENYQYGDVSKWIQELEKMPISCFEIIPVTTYDSRFKIDLNDKKIYNNFVNMCLELSDYYIEKLISGTATIMPSIFTGTIISIAKHTKTSHCGAGFDVSITPDLNTYPCHVMINENCKFIKLENYQNNGEFNFIRDLKRSNIIKCQECPAVNICGVLCKGMSVSNDNVNPPEERCLMMRIILNKIIEFLAYKYTDNESKIKKSILRVYSRYDTGAYHA